LISAITRPTRSFTHRGLPRRRLLDQHQHQVGEGSLPHADVGQGDESWVVLADPEGTSLRLASRGPDRRPHLAPGRPLSIMAATMSSPKTWPRRPQTSLPVTMREQAGGPDSGP
jgi:hypothetical protein